MEQPQGMTKGTDLNGSVNGYSHCPPFKAVTLQKDAEGCDLERQTTCASSSPTGQNSSFFYVLGGEPRTFRFLEGSVL